MNTLVCPHCKAHRIVTSRVPQDVVVVMPCPACGELNVLYRNKAIALNRQVLESGNFEERKNHLAHVIAEFLDTGIFNGQWPSGFGIDHGDASDENINPFEQERPRPRRIPRRRARPISDEEVERFVEQGLDQLDDPVLFRQIFG
ncbi:MAG: hypothetical protein IT368_14705 [Candidatus Hydrogenedentes bacterium]|nr:hypothetical protein [Candidatus Hydrogenedentota bacterium]